MVERSEPPIYRTVFEVAALWAAANAGYFLVLPALGFDLSYNSAPIAIAIYFSIWVVVSLLHFWSLFARWHDKDARTWTYPAVSLGFAVLLWGMLYAFSHFPTLDGPALAPYTDLLFATPWYFLPKALEILVQQILMSALILALYFRTQSYRHTVFWYGALFGGAHVVTFLASGAPSVHAAIMTIAALSSTVIFPFFILRVGGGFVYTYAIHLVFYLLLAMALHAWPPPGFIA